VPGPANQPGCFARSRSSFHEPLVLKAARCGAVQRGSDQIRIPIPSGLGPTAVVSTGVIH